MKRWLFWSCLVLLSGTFLYAGVLKILQPRAFQESILDYRVVDVATSALLAWWLPWFEVLCALSLWWPRFRYAGLVGTTLMVIGFLIILLSARARGLSVSCGCFGASGHGLWVAIAIDVTLLIACLAAWSLMRKLTD